MDRGKPSADDKNLWEDFRDTVRGGMHELRHMGDELARQGRLRMDLVQTERRLKLAYEDLGKLTFAHLEDAQPVIMEDTAVSELNSRVHYYLAELKRLHEELQHGQGSMN